MRRRPRWCEGGVVRVALSLILPFCSRMRVRYVPLRGDRFTLLWRFLRGFRESALAQDRLDPRDLFARLAQLGRGLQLCGHRLRPQIEQVLLLLKQLLLEENGLCFT